MILDAYIFYFQFLCSLFIGFGLFLGSYHLESELGKQVGEVDVGHPFIIISVFSTGSDQVVVIFQLPDVFGFVACQDEKNSSVLTGYKAGCIWLCSLSGRNCSFRRYFRR